MRFFFGNFALWGSGFIGNVCAKNLGGTSITTNLLYAASMTNE